MIENYFNNTGDLNTNTNPFLLGNDFSILSNTNNVYEPGTLLKETGYKQVGNVAIAKPVTGLHNFRQSSSVQKILSTANDSGDDDTQLFYNNAGTWTEISAAETLWSGKASINVDMTTYLGYCFFVGYGATDGFITPATLTGTTFSDTTNLVGAPEGAKFAVRYRDRMYFLNLYDGGNLPWRMGWCDIPVAGSIGWTEYVAGTAWQDVDYSEEITGGAQNWDRLVVFTEYSAYMYDGVSFKKVWDVGCSNHKTIKTYKDKMFWANKDGIWVSIGGGRPVNIAGKYMNLIHAGSPLNFFSEIVEGEYWTYIGNVSTGDLTYTNTAIVYNVLRNSCRAREFADVMTTFAEYNDGGVSRLYMGGNTGEVWERGRYVDTTVLTTDGSVTTTPGEPIEAIFEYAPMHFGDPSAEKSITKIIAFADKAMSLRLMYRIVDEAYRVKTQYKMLGELKDFINIFNSSTYKGKLIQIKGTEISSNSYFKYYGHTIEYA